jgi:hypothetical protein
MNSSFLVRLKYEHAVLAERHEKLEGFLLTDPYLALPHQQRVLLSEQAEVMKRYKEILEKRIALIEGGPSEPQLQLQLDTQAAA